jgi:hypothetical protein
MIANDRSARSSVCEGAGLGFRLQLMNNAVRSAKPFGGVVDDLAGSVALWPSTLFPRLVTGRNHRSSRTPDGLGGC